MNKKPRLWAACRTGGTRQIYQSIKRSDAKRYAKLLARSSSTAPSISTKSTAPVESTSLLRSPKRGFISHLSFKCNFCNENMESGRRILCPVEGCTKTYHLKCHMLPTVPPANWKCFSHYCYICYKEAVVTCWKCSAGLCEKCVLPEAPLEAKYTCEKCKIEGPSFHRDQILHYLKKKLDLKAPTTLVSSPN